MTTQLQRIKELHRLHESGCFVIPNPWDLGTARVLEQLGFPALATTSSGFAWSGGRSDSASSLREALAHFKEISEGVTIPVSADFQDCFAIDPLEVEKNVLAAAATGLSGRTPLRLRTLRGTGSRCAHSYPARRRGSRSDGEIRGLHRGRPGP
jgi:2-methylisocitrate lyase-like PEP mutase family enzyme